MRFSHNKVRLIRSHGARALALGIALSVLWTCASRAGEVSTIDGDGRVTVHPVPMEERFKNPSTPEWEKGFQDRYNTLLRTWTRDDKGGFGKVDNRRFFEGEKWSYPHAMMHVLAGNVKPGMELLQAGDQPQNPKDNAHTLGIDLYPAFTLKGQVRKYFQFGHMMDPGYTEKMEKAFKIWTTTHPRFTPHPVYKKYDPKAQGWGPNRFGHRQVDGRRTDNLYAMSTTSIYLFAEAAGNEETRLRAKSEILGYVWALYNIGHGEWDSTSYHPHVTGPYLNLYDFAKDPEVKLAAKLALDHFFTAAAIKYQRGAFLGASKRDYGGSSYKQMGSSCMAFFEMYFGGANEQHKEYDQLHGMASNYRPPQAVLALAGRDLELPVEILATKPNYENWKPGESDRPRNFETIWIGRHGGMGTAIDPGGNGDLAPFRIVLNRGKNLADVVAISSTPRLNTKLSKDQIGQYANLAIWIAPKRDKPWALLAPKAVALSEEKGVWFLEGESSWVALRLYGLEGFQAQAVPEGKKGKKHKEAYGDAIFQHAPATEDAAMTAIAVEVGEKGAFDSFADFRKAVLSKGALKVAEGGKRFTLTGGDGKVLEVGYNDEKDLPVVIRDGKERNWDDPKEWALWKTVGERVVVNLGWKEGVLTVKAGGHEFKASFEIKGHKGPEVTRESLEGKTDLTATISFENK